MITKQALQRTLIGITLKSVGITARLMDIPADASELKQQATRRELVDLSIIALSSLLLESFFQKVKLPKRIQPVAQFIPQLVAYVFSEWASRKVTNYNKVLNQSVNARVEAAEPPMPPVAEEPHISGQVTFSHLHPAATPEATKPSSFFPFQTYQQRPSVYYQPQSYMQQQMSYYNPYMSY